MKIQVIALALAAVPVFSSANPVFEITADHATSCRENGCRDFPKGFRFEASNWGSNDPQIAGTTVANGKANQVREAVEFDHRDVAPILDANGNMTNPTCQWPTGGMMQHAVTDAQGRVYIKRVEVVTKCVNGKMTTIQRALN
ncbi:hypothetical protein NK8_12870 [Caballeronia sp. NK8]|uniref:hypothetical protein n=1 Tax=Caballeronia sp. NK8 TaxID=140098 RepID=UPI001BB6A89D|nr:hypothetical protein [Caballeronia sp. NK8]BCQ23162.1 hypothetical protein NK8_12870 [Caballeronia sp. NK8]